MGGLLAERRRHYASFSLQIDTSRKTLDEVTWELQVALGTFHVRGMEAGYDVQVCPSGLDTIGERLVEGGFARPYRAGERCQRCRVVRRAGLCEHGGKRLSSHAGDIPRWRRVQELADHQPLLGTVFGAWIGTRQHSGRAGRWGDDRPGWFRRCHLSARGSLGGFTYLPAGYGGCQPGREDWL